jgi:hypothetical protein
MTEVMTTGTISGHSIWWREPPEIVLAVQEWRSDAACRDVDVGIFFPEQGGPAYAQARAICSRCPVIESCRVACDRAEAGSPRGRLYGVYAGESPGDRAARRRGAGE